VEVTVQKRRKPGIFSNVNKPTNHLTHNKLEGKYSLENTDPRQSDAPTCVRNSLLSYLSWARITYLLICWFVYLQIGLFTLENLPVYCVFFACSYPNIWKSGGTKKFFSLAPLANHVLFPPLSTLQPCPCGESEHGFRHKEVLPNKLAWVFGITTKGFKRPLIKYLTIDC